MKMLMKKLADRLMANKWFREYVMEEYFNGWMQPYLTAQREDFEASVKKLEEELAAAKKPKRKSVKKTDNKK